MNKIDINKFSNIEVFKLLNAENDDWAMRTLAMMGCVVSDSHQKPIIPLEYTQEGVAVIKTLAAKKQLFDAGSLLILTIVLSQVIPLGLASIMSFGLGKIIYSFLKKKYVIQGLLNNCYRYF